MADKKITALTEATESATEDLLHIIDDPAGTPVNKKLSVKNFLANITHVTTGTSAGTNEEILHLNHTANLFASATDTYDVVTTFVADLSAVDADATGNVGRLYTVDVTNTVNDANVRVITERSAARFTLDTGDANTSSSASYGMIVKVANSAATSSYAPLAYIKLEDRTSGTTANTSYVLDIAPSGLFGAAAGNNAAGPVSCSGTVSNPAGWLKIRVLGEDRYIELNATAS